MNDIAYATIVTVLIVGSSAVSYYLGLRRGRKDGVSAWLRKRRETDARLRRLTDDGTLPPSVRSAVIKPTSRQRSQVEVDDENG